MHRPGNNFASHLFRQAKRNKKMGDKQQNLVEPSIITRLKGKIMKVALLVCKNMGEENEHVEKLEIKVKISTEVKDK